MKYEVRCECGKAHAVTGADAGATLPCACGRTVEVPPLHRLRTAGGEAAVPLLVQVRGLIANGQLPGRRDCVCCGRPAALARVPVECEREVSDRVSRGEVVGCLLTPWLGWMLALFMVAGAKKAREASLEVSVILPLPVCDTCRPTLEDPAALRLALRHVPEYAALLDHYPAARVALRG